MITPPNVRIDNTSGLNDSILSVAQQAYYFYANQLALGGIFSSQKIIKIDGYEIILNLNKDFNYGFISGVADIVSPIVIKKDDQVCKIYLESGFYDLLSVGECTESAYLPAVLNYNSDIISYIESTELPLQGSVSILGDELGGEKILDNSVSNSLSCSQKLEEITDPCGTTYTAGGYCPNLWVLKDAQTVMPSSMFSGKLRLYIQAIYGSTRSDYKREGFILNIGDDSVPEEAEDYPIYNLTRGFTGSSWLYTTDDYDYFLCTPKGSVVTFTPLELTPCAIKFRDILIAHPEWDFKQKKRVEAYILAYARLTTKGERVVSIEGDDIIGSPLDYGWHSTWDGSTADVICFYDDPAAPQYLSDHHQITIQESLVEGEYIFTVTNTRIQSDKPWWPWTNGLQVFYYDEVEESMIPVEFPAVIFTGATGTFDSPIYCYYTLDPMTGNSELSVINLYMDISTSVNTNFDIRFQKYFDSDLHVYLDKVTHSVGDVEGTKGISVNNLNINIDINNSNNEQFAEVVDRTEPSLGFGEYVGNSVDSNDISDGTYSTSAAFVASTGFSIGDTRDGVNGTEYVKFYKNSFEWKTKATTYGSGRNTSGQCFIQTILGDCSRIAIGKSITSSHGGKTVIDSTQIGKYLGGTLVWSDTNMSALGPSIVEVIAVMPGPHYVSIRHTYTDNINPGPFITVVTPAEAESTEIEVYSNIESTLISEIITNEFILDEYFAPTISDKPTHTIDTGRRSIGNKYIINHSAFNKDGGFINDSSIGWA